MDPDRTGEERWWLPQRRRWSTARWNSGGGIGCEPAAAAVVEEGNGEVGEGQRDEADAMVCSATLRGVGTERAARGGGGV